MNLKRLMLALLCTVGAAHAAEVYKWTDAKGIVHYSDSPPGSDAGKVEKVRVGTSSALNEGAPEGPAPDVDAVAKDVSKTPPTPAAPAAPAPMQDTPENRMKLCNQSRANLELLQSKFQVAAPAGNGTAAAVLDEKARQDRMDTETSNIATYCK